MIAYDKRKGWRGALTNKDYNDNQEVIMGLRPEYISNIENDKKIVLEPTIIETTGFDKNVTFDFAGAVAADLTLPEQAWQLRPAVGFGSLPSARSP